MADTYFLLILISHALSAATVLLSFFFKLPQVIRLYNQKSVTGLNLYSLLLELGSYSITASYNYINQYSLMSYLEYPVIIVQEWILIFLFLKYSQKLNLKYSSIFAVYVSVIVCICQGVVPPKVLDFGVVLCTPISLSSKIIQLWEIWRLKSADSLSLTTWFLSAFTNFTRVYTIALDSADLLLLTNFTFSGLLSSSILLSAKYLQKKKLS